MIRYTTNPSMPPPGVEKADGASCIATSVGITTPGRPGDWPNADRRVCKAPSPSLPAGTLKVVHGPAFFDWLAAENRRRWLREG